MRPAIDPRLLYTPEAAEYCGMKRDSFLSVAISRQVRPLRLTSRPQWDVRDLDKMIDQAKERNDHA